MAENERIAALKLRFQVQRDRSVDAEFKKMRSDIEAQNRVVTQFNKELENIARSRYIDNLAAQFKALPPQLASTQDKLKIITAQLEAIGATDDEIKRVARSLADMGKAGVGGGRGRGRPLTADDRFDEVSRNVGLFGDAETALRTIGATGVAPEIFAVAEALPRFKVALEGLPEQAKLAAQALGASGLGLLGALAGLAVAIAFFNSENEKASRSVKDLIATQAEYYRILITGTRDQLQAARDNAKTEADILRARIAENKRIFEGFDEQVGGVGRALADVFDLGGAKTLREETQKLEGELRQADFLTRRYDQALANNATSAKDATAALDEFNQFLQDFTDRAAQARLQANIAVDSLTSSSARDRLNAIQLEIDLTEQSIQTENLSAEAVKQLTDRLLVLRTTAAVIEQALAGIDARTQRSASIEAVKKYNDDLSRINQQARDAETAAHEKYADTVVAIAERAADAAENALRKLREKQEDLATDLARDVADAEAERQREQIEAQIKLADEEAKAARDHASELQRIRREGQRDERQAIQDRDAVALDAAQTRTREALQDENLQYAEQERERQIAFAKELRDQRTQYAREAQDRYLKYQRDLADAQTQYNREIALAEANRQQALLRAAENYRQEQAQIAQKYALERQQLQQAITAELATINMGHAQRLRLQAEFENTLVAQSQRILGRLSAFGSGYGSIAPTQDTGHVIPFARGGFAPANRNLLVGERGPELVRFRQPSRIFSASQTRQMGQTFTFNFEGATLKTIDVRSKDQAVQFVGKTLEKMGAR